MMNNYQKKKKIVLELKLLKIWSIINMKKKIKRKKGKEKQIVFMISILNNLILNDLHTFYINHHSVSLFYLTFQQFIQLIYLNLFVIFYYLHFSIIITYK
jgi:hypothetical protein